MMKKLNYLFVALMTMLLVASCSQDDTLSVDTNSNEALVSFNLELPDSGPQSRAIGDGSSVKKLIYAVYQVDGENLTKIGDNQTATITDKTATVKQSLLKGKSYKIAFWAQVGDKSYYDTDDLTNVTVNYEGDNNDESRDAFFAAHSFTVTSDASIDVVLNRPFAQINVGVTGDDFANATKAGLTVSHSSVVIKNAASKINLLTGEATDEVPVTYKLADIPTDSETLTAAGEEYKYLSMSYILVGEEKTTLEDLTYTFENTEGTESVVLTQGLTSVPVQRNYRTNIVGKLLTGDIDFNITIDDIFNEPDNNSMVVKNNTELEAALANGKVQNIILDGTFNEKINIGRSVTISGIATTNGIEVNRDADDVTFSDLQLTLKGNHSLNTWAKNTIIKNSVITTNGLGVYFNKSSSGSVINNEITGRKAVGADTDQEVVITGNILMFTSMGIEVFEGSTSYVFNNETDQTDYSGNSGIYTVEDNTFMKQFIVTNDGELTDALATSDNQIVLNGTFAGFTIERPVAIKAAESATVDGGILVKSDNVVIDGLTANYIEMYNGVSGIVVKNNTITGQIGSVGIGNSSGPVHLGEAVIQNNILKGGSIGFYPTKTLDNYVIKDNTIEVNIGEGIWLHYTADYATLFNQDDAIAFATNLVSNNTIAVGPNSLVKVETASTKVTEDGVNPLYVKTEEELLNAIKNTTTEMVFLASDIELNNEINVSRNVTINGNNHILTKPSGGKMFLLAKEATEVTFENMEMNLSGKDSNGIYYRNECYLTIKNSKITGENQEGDAINPISGSSGTLVLENNHFENLYRAFYLNTDLELKISGNTFSNCYRALVLHAATKAPAIFSGNTFTGNGSYDYEKGPRGDVSLGQKDNTDLTNGVEAQLKDNTFTDGAPKLNWTDIHINHIVGWQKLTHYSEERGSRVHFDFKFNNWTIGQLESLEMALYMGDTHVATSTLKMDVYKDSQSTGLSGSFYTNVNSSGSWDFDKVEGNDGEEIFNKMVLKVVKDGVTYIFISTDLKG